MKRTLASLAAAATLSGGLVACTTDEVKDGAASATSAAGSAAAEATSAAGNAASGSEESAEGESAEGETVEQETADGKTTLIPADLKTGIENASDWGLPESIQVEGDTALAAFQDGHYLVWSKDNGVAPLVGKIAETWVGGGGLSNELGLPTAPEKELPNGEGWTQSFTNGVLQWVNENGEWGPKFEPRP